MKADHQPAGHTNDSHGQGAGKYAAGEAHPELPVDHNAVEVRPHQESQAAGRELVTTVRDVLIEIEREILDSISVVVEYARVRR